jgi:hypothetical protein
MYELTRAQQWLFQQLKGAAGLTAFVEDRIYEAPAPQDMPVDELGKVKTYVLLDHRAGTDVTAGNGTRMGSQIVFAVEIVTEISSNRALEPLYDAIDDALQGQKDTYRGLIIDMTQRDTNYTEWGVESGSTRRHLGGLWRLFVRAQVLAP